MNQFWQIIIIMVFVIVNAIAIMATINIWVNNERSGKKLVFTTITALLMVVTALMAYIPHESVVYEVRRLTRYPSGAYMMPTENGVIVQTIDDAGRVIEYIFAQNGQYIINVSGEQPQITTRIVTQYNSFGVCLSQNANYWIIINPM